MVLKKPLYAIFDCKRFFLEKPRPILDEDASISLAMGLSGDRGLGG